MAIHDTKNRKHNLSDFCLFAEETKESPPIPSSVANTFFTLTSQSKIPDWCLFSGIDIQKLRRYVDSESGYTVPRAWENRKQMVFFVSPFFFNNQLVVPLCFFGRIFNRTQVITMHDVDNGKGYQVYLGDLIDFCGYADKEVFNLVRAIV